jgi:hypothetical protein
VTGYYLTINPLSCANSTTPGSGDPYQYIRTGYYAKILAKEAEVQRAASSGNFMTPHLHLNRWQAVNSPPTPQGKEGAKTSKDGVKKEDKGAKKAVAKARVAAFQQKALNVASQKWQHVKDSPMSFPYNPIAAAHAGAKNFFAQAV